MNRRIFLSLGFLVFITTVIKIKWSNKLFANVLKKNQTQILTHKIFHNHIFSKNHPEKPDRLIYTLDILKKKKLDDLLREINFKINEKKWIETIHTKKHITSLKKKFPTGEQSSAFAVKGCLQGVDEIMNQNTKNVFCAVRPPGHHALNTGKDEGFCFYNHVAIAARYIQKKYFLKKILIVDWDYHHGNSTELFFYNDPSILFFSTHDVNAYPRTGFVNRKGDGQGKGFNINVHLPCGTKDEKIIAIFKNVLLRKAYQFKPDFIIISAGFDSRRDDPLGCFDVSDRGFEELTKIVMKIAHKFCDGRILSVLEGGYNIEGNALAVSAHIDILNNFNKNI